MTRRRSHEYAKTRKQTFRRVVSARHVVGDSEVRVVEMFVRVPPRPARLHANNCPTPTQTTHHGQKVGFLLWRAHSETTTRVDWQSRPMILHIPPMQTASSAYRNIRSLAHTHTHSLTHSLTHSHTHTHTHTHSLTHSHTPCITHLPRDPLYHVRCPRLDVHKP